MQHALVMFDTLEYMDELKKSGMNPKEAEAITRATAKAFEQMMELKQLTTKSDLIETENSLKQFIVRVISSSVIMLASLQTLFHLLNK